MRAGKSTDCEWQRFSSFKLYSDSFPTAMNEGQQKAMQVFHTQANMFLSGPGGVGKSYMITNIQNDCKAQDLTVAVTSTTGISGILIGGITVHSYFGLGTGNKTSAEFIRSITRNKKIRERCTRLDVLIIDEVSMLCAELMEKIDDVLRHFRKNKEESFGGVQVVLVGDFFQLPVVNKKEHFLFESERWISWAFTTVNLTENMRQRDLEWSRILNNIRIGKPQPEDLTILRSRIGCEPNQQEVLPTMLYATNAQVDEENLSQLRKLEGELIIKMGVYEATDDQPQEMIKKFFPYYLEDVRLVKGCQVMFLVNKPDEGLANGTRGVVVDFTRDRAHPIVQTVEGTKITVVPHVWEIDVDNITYKLTQYPLKLAWAVTIHKSQGLSLDCVRTSIGHRIFEYGQAYVALSRVRSLEGLYLEDFMPSKIRANPLVKLFYSD